MDPDMYVSLIRIQERGDTEKSDPGYMIQFLLQIGDPRGCMEAGSGSDPDPRRQKLLDPDPGRQ